MTLLRVIAATWCICASLSVFANQDKQQSQPLTFVIVHGATGGGWDWKGVAKQLTGANHEVYRATLTGLGEKVHLRSPDVNLSTHVNDVVNLIIFEQLDNVVLVGHSYGGMVISGVMDAIPERISHATFLDAAVPNDGMSAIDVYGPLPPANKVIDGIIHFEWIDKSAPFPRDVAQPYNTFSEPVSFDNPLIANIDVTYVAFIPKGESAVIRKRAFSWENAKSRNWTMRVFEGDHVIYRQKPVEMAALLVESASDKNTE